VIRRVLLAGVVAILGVAPAYAQGSDSTGYVGRTKPRLEIDDCRPNDPTLTQDQLRERASEHFRRGETLYVQGDYEGSVTEFVAAYCVMPYYAVLKDIGQAYERRLEYEMAIGYLERYVEQIPPDAKRANACAPDPIDDKANVDRRIRVLENLPSRVYVQTTPPGAAVVIGNDSGIAARAKSGDQITINGGTYDMTIELAGHVPVTQQIDVKIGKPYTYYFKLEPQRGSLSVLVNPPDARIFVDDRLVGIGRYEDKVPGGTYTVSAEAPGRVRVERKIEVLPDEAQGGRELIELEPLPQTGRRQLIVASAIGGGVATGALLYAFNDTSVAGLGTLVGGAAGLVGSYLKLPRDQALGTSNLTITTMITGGVAGLFAARAFTDRQEIIQPVAGASLLLGGAAGYYVGSKLDVTPGDAAIFTSSVLWGTTAGGLFAFSFDPPRGISSGLVLSGLGMGSIGGILLARSFDISRTHAVLIDIGGVAGIIGGLAVKSLAYPSTSVTDESADNERQANYALGGMAIGLVAAGILTRNVDEPKIPLKPSLGTATTSDGKSTATFGFAGDF
jgi:hypothetical protein